MAKKPKRPVSGPKHSRKEIPRRRALPGSETSDERICWRFCHLDHDGPWSLAKLDPEGLRWLCERLAQLESMRIHEIFNNGDHPGKDYDVARIPVKEAQERLEIIGLADMTKIWRLRLQGKPRLYGFLLGHVFHLLWWDPEHEVWPSTKKHT